MKLSRKSKVVLVLLMVAASACFAQKWKSLVKKALKEEWAERTIHSRQLNQLEKKICLTCLVLI